MTTQRYDTRIGTLTFTQDFANGYPTTETISTLYDTLDFQRACQAYLWAIPLVSMSQWQYVHNHVLGASNGQIVLIESYTDRLGGLTYNATTPYVLPFIDLSEGPFIAVMPEGEVRGQPMICGKFRSPRLLNLVNTCLSALVKRFLRVQEPPGIGFFSLPP
jgi:hypothetical protein